MALPHKLKDFNLFGDGNNWQGQIPSLTLPELARAVEEYRGGGMDGSVELDMGQEVIEFAWQAAGIIAEIFTEYGTPLHDANLLRFAGSYESDETGGTIPVEVTVRGRHKTIGMGEVTAGDNNSIEVTTTCSYYKLVVDGETLIEIDVPGNVFIVRGVDRRAERRRNLGL
ncbi:phage major tail tube protein [Halomonas urumqiensis]|uniref:Phage major tail tube protein n=1 Tax=Halomonas urumqiensis TaxID=1684789 RepID=A0A2N7UDK2_9GAMM|nr:phage major tail tube protein [Halomonas urumqiensis]PMR78524.1 phage major tail tube protein [Halomonas urumqiensis]PTB03669.1 phage major tail tube protein [Halomonas urumqiensis]GHE20119.1 major tail tube protein [Halomonas urumqiensis]